MFDDEKDYVTENLRYQYKIEKERSRQELYKTILYLGFWFLVIGGCVASDLIHTFK